MTAVHRTATRGTVSVLATLAMLATLLPGVAQAQQAQYGVAQACPTNTTPSAGFNDVGGVHAAGINCLAHFGIAEGKTATHFGAADGVTRGQTASFLKRKYRQLDDVTVPPRDTDAFSDVAGTAHRENIERLANFDPAVLRGFDDGTFRPGHKITRAQFASSIVRLIDQVAAQSNHLSPLPAATRQPFTDVPAGGTHSDNINRLAQAGILEGVTANRFEPSSLINRAQSATIVARVLGGFVDAGLHERQETVVTGVVHDATDAKPNEYGPRLSNVTVQIANGAARTVTTDAQGRYSVTLGRDTTYTLTIQRSGFLPHQQTVNADTAALTVDFPMYQTATVPTASVTTTTTPAQVQLETGFWRIPIYTAGNVRRSAQQADEIILARADGVVIQLGAAGTDDSWWSRTGTCASDRTGAQVGDHTVYYRYGTAWYSLTARFGNQGQLTHVNGVRYTACPL
jgi:hypothetical protein